MTTYETLVADARAGEAELVQVERAEAHAIVRMDDPGSLNALSAPLTLQLLDALTDLTADASVRAIVLTGSDPAFSAGGDLRLMRDHAHKMVDESPGGATDAWRWIRRQFADRPGAQGRELGLVNEVVPHEDLIPTALAHVERMSELPPHVVPMTKTLLRQAADMSWDQAIAMEEFAEPMCFTTTGHREAVAELLLKGRSRQS